MNISIGSDRSGFPLKGTIIDALISMGHNVIDCDSNFTGHVDFPDITRSVCSNILDGNADRGIMVCGTGVGAAIAANKIPGIRASVCHDVFSAHQCVEHDDVNVCCFGAQIVGPKLVVDLIREFLNAKFTASEEFKRRLVKLEAMENESKKRD